MFEKYAKRCSHRTAFPLDQISVITKQLVANRFRIKLSSWTLRTRRSRVVGHRCSSGASGQMLAAFEPRRVAADGQVSDHAMVACMLCKTVFYGFE